MNQLLDDLIKVMTLERLEMNLFRGESRDIGSPQVFGGQVLGQALVAATATVGRSRRCTRCMRISCAAGISIRPSFTRSTGRSTASISPRGASSPFSTAGKSSTCRPRSNWPKPAWIIRFRCRMCRPRSPCPTWNPTIAAWPINCPPAARRMLEQKRPFEFRPVQPPDSLRPGEVRAAQVHLVPRRGQAAPTTRRCIAACSPMCPIFTCSTPR